MQESLPTPLLPSTKLQYPEWSNDGTTIALTFYNDWGSRGLLTIDFNSPQDFTVISSKILIAESSASEHLDATEPVFSHDDQLIYFRAPTDTSESKLYSIPSTGGAPIEVLSSNGPFERVFAPSVSPDGMKIIFNSEMYKVTPTTHLDEEVMELDLVTGALTQLTFQPGHQYGQFARNGNGEFVLQSSTIAGGNSDILIQENGVQQSVDINDPNNDWDDYSPDWWKEP